MAVLSPEQVVSSNQNLRAADMFLVVILRTLADIFSRFFHLKKWKKSAESKGVEQISIFPLKELKLDVRELF